MSPRLRTSANGFLTVQLVRATRVRSVRHQDAALSFGSALVPHCTLGDSPVMEASQGSVDTRRDGWCKTVNQALARRRLKTQAHRSHLHSRGRTHSIANSGLGIAGKNSRTCRCNEHRA